MAANPVRPEELASLLRETEDAARAFLGGDAAPYLALSSATADFTIFGPFGGPPTVSFAAYRKLAPLAAGAFADGTVRLDLVQSYASGDLLVLVLDENQRARLDGGPAQDWSLRVTQVYRREGDGWRVVHRHADPLVHRRTIADAAALARGP